MSELASQFRPALLRLSRILRNQRVDLSVTLTQLSALFTCRQHGPMSAGELAAQEKVQPPSMTKVIAGLEENGYVLREVDPNDRRQSIIAVTDAGRTLLDDELRLRDAWLTRRLAELAPAELAVIEAAIPVLFHLADQ
jgi:DNA-binding MarR family transcriptional regulator